MTRSQDMFQVALCAAILVGGAPCSNAQPAAAWPERPVRIVVPFVPGGAADNVARLLAPKFQERLGKPFVIENRAGGGGHR